MGHLLLKDRKEQLWDFLLAAPHLLVGAKQALMLFLLSSFSALPLEVKCVPAVVAEELPPRRPPFACRGKTGAYAFLIACGLPFFRVAK